MYPKPIICLPHVYPPPKKKQKNKSVYPVEIGHAREESLRGTAPVAQRRREAGPGHPPPLPPTHPPGLQAVIAGVTKNIILVYVAFLSFGSTALLFLVIEELVHQAKVLSGGGHGVWWVNVWLYIGFIAVILSERLLPAAPSGH